MKTDHPSSSISRMTRIAVLQFAAVCTLTSCVSTEVADYNNTSDCIEIMISNPAVDQIPGTRVSYGLQLRYVATLYFSGKDNMDPSNLVERQECLASQSKTIRFEAKKGEGQYTVTVFADYIRQNAPVNNGHYEDYLYTTNNTGSSHATVEMKLKDTTSTDRNLNNDDYTCFSAIETFTKEAPEKIVDLTLKHAVCKIRVVDNSGSENLSKVDKIQINDISFTKNYVFGSYTGSSVVHKVVPSSTMEATPTDLSKGELFYFYSFPTASGQATFEDVKFTITGKDKFVFNGGKPITIYQDKFIGLSANTIYTLKSGFANVTTTPSSNITVNMTENPDWGYVEK